MKRMVAKSLLRVGVLFAFGVGALPLAAAEPVSFKGKTVTVIVGTSTGGTTDFSTRLMATYLGKHLPGAPNMVVQNRPGAHGLAALNSFAQQAKGDGLTLGSGSITQLDPQTYRVPQSHYDPSTFIIVGAVEIGGGILIVQNEAVPRLTDAAAKPVAMGSVAGYPHVTMLMTAWGREFMGWNTRWVAGYPSDTSSLVLALERGEVDMTAFSATGLSPSLLDKAKYTIMYQTGSDSGTVPSPLKAIADVPLFRTAMKGHIADPLAQQAFDYWCESSSVAVWLALPPGTPDSIVGAYRTAFAQAVADPEFTSKGKTFSEDFGPVPSEHIASTIKLFAGVSPEVLGFMPQMLRRQGLKVE